MSLLNSQKFCTFVKYCGIAIAKITEISANYGATL